MNLVSYIATGQVHFLNNRVVVEYFIADGLGIVQSFCRDPHRAA